MHLIKRRTIKGYCERHPAAAAALAAWAKTIESRDWGNLAELRQTFSAADSVGNFTVFNIKGNNYRLITYIDYDHKKVFVRDFLTHSEYDRGRWKYDDWFRGPNIR